MPLSVAKYGDQPLLVVKFADAGGRDWVTQSPSRGDEHLVQLNQTTLERLVEDPPEAKPAALPAPAAEDPPEEPPEDGAEKPSNVIRNGALEFMRQQRKQA